MAMALGALVPGIAFYAPVVLAADDYGTQSVFAHGAGDRAIAMGSAFVAAADDASALYWNPAGLGDVERSVLQLNQSGDLVLGFRESYLAMAVPSWRWGTMGLTLRQFGVGGIEQRDDRNVLLSSDLRDSETEMAMGFGRRIGAAIRVGGALKIQRQSLAGLSASGVGADIGVRVSPPGIERMSIGLAVRNALPPSIRLDREALSDPMTVRTGIGYRMPLAGVAGVLAEVDVEKAAASAARLHAGIEYHVVEMATLRAGLNGNLLTAGTGLQWNKFNLDYAFENNALGAAHRLGVSLRLGLTVSESRLAARNAEDRALDRRMAETFQRRQSQQVEELMTRGRDAVPRGRFDDALDAVGAVLTLQPADSAAARFQRDCLKGKAAQLEQSSDYAAAAAAYDLAVIAAPGDPVAVAGAARCRDESNQKAARTTTARVSFAAAMNALAVEDFVAARDSFAAVLRNVPDDSEAARMLAHTEETIVHRAAHLVDAANRDLKAGRLAEAGAQLESAARLDRNVQGLDETGAALARARRVAEASARAPQVTPQGNTLATVTPSATSAPVSTLSDREVEVLYRLGLTALKSQRNNDALGYWERVWAERPGYREVGDFLKREYLARGMEAFAAGKLEGAVSLWEKVLRINPKDLQARGYVARAQEQMVRSRELTGSDN